MQSGVGLDRTQVQGLSPLARLGVRLRPRAPVARGSGGWRRGDRHRYRRRGRSGGQQEHIPWARLERRPAHAAARPSGRVHRPCLQPQRPSRHLDEAMQDLWLAELRRVTRPGGHVLLSIVGEGPFGRNRCLVGRRSRWDVGRIRADWADPGFVFIEDDMWVGGPFPDFYHVSIPRTLVRLPALDEVLQRPGLRRSRRARLHGLCAARAASRVTCAPRRTAGSREQPTA